MMTKKKALTTCPIHELLADRWSPYAFQDSSISPSDLCSLFEAARWSASSYNEQPWRYIVAAKEDPDQFQQILSCLTEGNQVWAKKAPVLALGIASLKFTLNHEDNRAAIYDLGAASANLAIEAMARGIYVHQMIGIFPDRARDCFGIPEGFEAWTGMAIGYPGDPLTLPDALKERDLAPRQRKTLDQFVFSGKWDNASPLVLK
jgi:nitroreductase